MTLLRISELAERSGMPTTTLRYYERIGLVEPLGRLDNGYRVYDEAAAARLGFIARAKRLGMTLDDVATLVEAWIAGDCEPVQERLRSFVAGRITELRRQLADESAFERQMERILTRLNTVRPGSKRCSPDCGCDAFEDPLETAEVNDVACSLGAGDAERRRAEWRRVIGAAQRTERTVGGLRVVFDLSAPVIAELARLGAAEVACCPFFVFTLEITASAVILEVAAPPGAGEMIAALFDHGADALA